ncbi:P-loop containing nucleoside triphosphate hydrolase protein [Neoconidiobolus thromboides FSU 785]|nr:P-loop containing nucleoside triphosphate hydrolase protein [Neoconidiobolus thromboides FSU 785]
MFFAYQLKLNKVRPFFLKFNKRPYTSKDLWNKLNLNHGFTNALSTFGIEAPNSLQLKVIPKIQTKKDLVVTAETGSGKTLAYLLPLIQEIIHSDTIYPIKHPHAIILVPNKELAWQVGSVIKSILYHLENNRVEIAFDKTKILQNNQGQNKVILISTPSALVDDNQSSFKTTLKSLNTCNTIVVDEADLLLSRSYGGKTEALLAQLTKANKFEKQKQFVFVGASLDPSSSKKAIKTYLKKKFPKALYFDSRKKHKTVDTLSESFIKAPNKLSSSELFTWKLSHIIGELKQERNCSSPKHNEKLPRLALVFFNSIENVKQFHEQLSTIFNYDHSILCIDLHKELPKKEREDKLKLLKFGPGTDELQDKNPGLIIVCTTDIMARGIDLENLNLVIQADFPFNISTYLHRAGRTARAGRPGKVLSYVMESDLLLATEIETLKNMKTKVNKGHLNEEVGSFDGLFSRRRSLNRKLKAKNAIEDPQNADNSHQ